MNAHQVDYSFVLGVVSAAIGVCVLFIASCAVRALWRKMNRTMQLRHSERRYRRFASVNNH
jgi:hypothetical protein